MQYKGRIELAAERKIRERNTTRYRMAHWPIWIWVFFLAPGPLTFSLFAHGVQSLELDVAGRGVGRHRHCRFVRAAPRRLSTAPYILRFDEDKPNPLYRKVCYTFAWNAVLSFALLNLAGLVGAVIPANGSSSGFTDTLIRRSAR